jgi:ADYC domain
VGAGSVPAAFFASWFFDWLLLLVEGIAMMKQGFGGSWLFVLLGLLFGCTVSQMNSPVGTVPATPVMVKGQALKDIQFNAQDEQGRTLDFWIRDVELDPEDVDREIHLYTVFFQDPQDAQWKNLCEPDAENVAKAIPLQGFWDEQGNHRAASKTLTFGCTSGALGKCVRMGYKPWKTVNGQPLSDLHQACTRMVRADYCGNGQGHTYDGTPIDVYDRLGIQNPTPNSGMVFEAAWAPDGAVFINHARWHTPAELLQACPEKLTSKLNPAPQPFASEQVKQMFPTVALFNDSFLR